MQRVTDAMSSILDLAATALPRTTKAIDPATIATDAFAATLRNVWTNGPEARRAAYGGGAALVLLALSRPLYAAIACAALGRARVDRAKTPLLGREFACA